LNSLLLADFGADVVRIDRPSTFFGPKDSLSRRKLSIILDLKSPPSREILFSLISKADVFLDPFRPGVLEKLGLSPESLLERNPRLIVARLTGYRRTGPYAKAAGHDINYLAMSGVLSLLGRKGEAPYAPINVLGDFGGGGLPCFTGILLALLSRAQTGKGQVVEVNMVDGVQYLATFARFSIEQGTRDWNKPRGENLLDGAAPFYGTYETKDGKYMAVGAMEPQFYAEFVKLLGFSLKELPDRGDNPWPNDKNWAKLRGIFKKRFLEKTQEEWCSIFEGTDACVSPVLPLLEAAKELNPIIGLSETPSLDVSDRSILNPGEGSDRVLSDWLGWKHGKEYTVDGKTVKQSEKSRL
jgi:alpha-methylacyl-CoA racemase